MKKRIYKQIPVNSFLPSSIDFGAMAGRLVFAIDVAKVDMVAAIATSSGQVISTISWKAPMQNAKVIELLTGFKEAGLKVEAVMESTGTYGDVLRFALETACIPLYRVSGKRTHDAREVFDGVPSLHDAKSAAILAKLHAEGLSSPWIQDHGDRRQLTAAIAIMDLHQERYLQLVHRLESWLARHWPESTSIFELTSAALLALLARIGPPAEVAKQLKASFRLMKGMGHGLIDESKIASFLETATTTVGVPCEGLERDALMAIAGEAHKSIRAFKGAKLVVERLAVNTAANAMAPVVGKTTAAVVFAEAGDPRDFKSAGAFVKAIGLNLREKSSGMTTGRISITKRGPNRVRQFLWLAAHRWVQSDPLAAQWYARKKQRDGGFGAKATVALMRKLAKALFHVARGATFDSRLLFDREQRKAA
jgi:transposase